ncbi:MAG: hypothetical protein RL576_115 [Actinomycetota bacterium]
MQARKATTTARMVTSLFESATIESDMTELTPEKLPGETIEHDATNGTSATATCHATQAFVVGLTHSHVGMACAIGHCGFWVNAYTEVGNCPG